MATVSLTPTPYFQGLDANGNPINGGKLFAYQAGTTIKQDTYTTAAGSTPNANPVILDSAGRASVFLDVSLSYKLVLAPANDTDPPVSPIWTQDNITAVPASVTVIPTGLVVGFAGSVVNDVIQLGDADFRLDFDSGTAPRLQYAAGDYASYNRAVNYFEWSIASTGEARLSATGFEIANGLNVGIALGSVAVVDDRIQIGDANFNLDFGSGATPRLVFDTGDDRIIYTRATDTYAFQIGGTSEMTLDASGLTITNGLVVGYAGTPGDDQIRIGDASTLLLNYNGGSPYIQFGNTTPATAGTIRFSKSDSLSWRNAANTSDMTAVAITGDDILRLGSGAADILWGKGLVALGGGAAPTVGTIGGSGPAVAAQNTWMRVLDSTGVAFFVPAWK